MLFKERLNNAIQADYFYGRNTNNFWCILPRVFGGENLKYSNRETKVKYIKKKKIGITDLVRIVPMADINNQDHVGKLTIGFSDTVLNQFNLEFNTSEIIKLIDLNKKRLKGVYLTRSTLNGINQIRDN